MRTMPADDTLVEVTSVSNPKLQITPEEGFVLSRAMGRRISIGELVQTSGMPEPKAREILQKLFAERMLVPVEATGRHKAPAEDDPYAGFIFPAGVLDEPCDLTEAQRRRIVFIDAQLGSLSHYKLLGVKRTAPQSDIKAGYFKASKEFHPDAFFRRNLGTFKPRIDRIFRAMKQAYDVLSDPKRRAEYDATLIGELTPEEEAEIERRAAERRRIAAEKEREERSEKRLAEQRMKRNPMVDRIKKAQELMLIAEKAVVEKKPLDAERNARLALEYAPYDADMKRRAEGILKWGAQERARNLVTRLGRSFKYVDADTLVRVADEVADLAHGDGQLLVEAARIMNAAEKKVRAFKLAQDATEADPRNVDGWRMLAELAAADEKWATAVRAAERWLALSPHDAEAKELAKLARRNAR